MTRASTAAKGRGTQGSATVGRETGRTRSADRFKGGQGRTLGELGAIASCQVVGDPNLPVLGVAEPEKAGASDMVFLVEAKFRDRVIASDAGFILASEAIDDRVGLVAKHPRVAMAKVLAAFAPQGPEPGIASTAFVEPSATLGPDISIGAGVSVGARAAIGPGTVLHPNVVIYPDVRIGRDCIIHAGAVIRESCVLGDRVIVQPGAVIGADGFGFVPTADGNVKIPQLGSVIIEDDVEIGANTTIDRGTLGDTVVGRGTKLDNLVHLAHNVEVGIHSMLVAQVGISGSTKLGARCVFGGQSGAVGHITIGEGVTVAAKSGVTKDLAPGQLVSGFPARPHKDELRRQAEFARLAKRLERLEARLAELEGSGGA
jgi:UDP-3-O-[3-hydroxymyristoyl] glucosamine N-acyltransferase